LVNNSWQFEWLTSWEEIWNQDFVTQWQNWIDESHTAHVFFEPSVVQAWVITYKKLLIVEPRFLIARSGVENIVFLPLVYVKNNWKNAWQRAILPVGYSEFDYHDPIVLGDSEPEVIGKFWRELFTEIHLKWGKSLDFFAINGLKSNVTASNFKVTQSECAPFIKLNGMNSIEDFTGSLSQSLRGDINRQKRRLERMGEIRLHTFMKDETDEAMNILPRILSEHSRKWSQSYKAPEFHESLFGHCFNSGILHISELFVAGNQISWHIGFLHKLRFYWYMPVYKPEYQQYSPGKIHLYMCVEEALRKGITVFDLLKGDEDYKRQWTKDSIALFDLRYNSKRIISSIRSALVSTIKPAISTVLHSLKK
jgi:CelD/BcsL family acetyltransferase involved in cellulose biosynthesis